MSRPRQDHGQSLDNELGPSFQHSSSQDYDQEATYAEPSDFAHIASVEEKKRLWWRSAVVNLLFIASWFFFAIILSVYNKWMFDSGHFNFPYPLFVTSLHMVVQFILAGLVLNIWPKHFKPERSPTPEEYGKKAVPTACATSLDIGLSNLSLKTVTLSFYTMVKSSSLIFVLAFAFMFHLETPSWRLVGVISLIFIGVLLMVATETHFVLGGFLLVLSGSALGGLRWGLTQKLLFQNKKMGFSNPAATIFFLSPVMALTLGILSLIVESWSSLFASDFFSGVTRSIQTILLLLAPGCIAFCMVLSEFYIIQRAGMVPMSIAGIAKEVVTILVSAWFFGDELTPLNITGVAITICGIALYTYHKYLKSVQSTVPLDGHGNPIVEEESALHPHGDPGYFVELDETARLTSERDIDAENEPRHMLFSADDED